MFLFVKDSYTGIFLVTIPCIYVLLFHQVLTSSPFLPPAYPSHNLGMSFRNFCFVFQPLFPKSPSFCHVVTLAWVPLTCPRSSKPFLCVCGKLSNRRGSNNSPCRRDGFKVREVKMFPIKQLLLKLRKKLDLYIDYMISPDKSSWWLECISKHFQKARERPERGDSAKKRKCCK
jgi:hypothetical protein